MKNKAAHKQKRKKKKEKKKKKKRASKSATAEPWPNTKMNNSNIGTEIAKASALQKKNRRMRRQVGGKKTAKGVRSEQDTVLGRIARDLVALKALHSASGIASSMALIVRTEGVPFLDIGGGATLAMPGPAVQYQVFHTDSTADAPAATATTTTNPRHRILKGVAASANTFLAFAKADGKRDKQKQHSAVQTVSPARPKTYSAFDLGSDRSLPRTADIAPHRRVLSATSCPCLLGADVLVIRRCTQSRRDAVQQRRWSTTPPCSGNGSEDEQTSEEAGGSAPTTVTSTSAKGTAQKRKRAALGADLQGHEAGGNPGTRYGFAGDRGGCLPPKNRSRSDPSKRFVAHNVLPSSRATSSTSRRTSGSTHHGFGAGDRVNVWLAERKDDNDYNNGTICTAEEGADQVVVTVRVLGKNTDRIVPSNMVANPGFRPTGLQGWGPTPSRAPRREPLPA